MWLLVDCRRTGGYYAKLVFLVIALTGVSGTARADPQGELLARVRAETEPIDHTVKLGGYEYEVFMNRGVSPPAVVIRMTERDLDRIFAAKSDKRFKETLDAQKKLERAYVRKLRGEPEEEEPSQPPAKWSKNHWRGWALRLPEDI